MKNVIGSIKVHSRWMLMLQTRYLNTEEMIRIFIAYLERKGIRDVTVDTVPDTTPSECGFTLRYRHMIGRCDVSRPPFKFGPDITVLEITGYYTGTRYKGDLPCEDECPSTIRVMNRNGNINNLVVVQSEEEMNTKLPQILMLADVSSPSQPLPKPQTDSTPPSADQNSDIAGLLRIILGLLQRIQNNTSARP